MGKATVARQKLANRKMFPIQDSNTEMKQNTKDTIRTVKTINKQTYTLSLCTRVLAWTAIIAVFFMRAYIIHRAARFANKKQKTKTKTKSNKKKQHKTKLIGTPPSEKPIAINQAKPGSSWFG